MSKKSKKTKKELTGQASSNLQSPTNKKQNYNSVKSSGHRRNNSRIQQPDQMSDIEMAADPANIREASFIAKDQPAMSLKHPARHVYEMR